MVGGGGVANPAGAEGIMSLSPPVIAMAPHVDRSPAASWAQSPSQLVKDLYYKCPGCGEVGVRAFEEGVGCT